MPKYKLLEKTLTGLIPKIESCLPDHMRGQAPRLVSRALLTFEKKEDLHSVTPLSFVRCVLEAADLGFAIDGRLAYAVKFANKVKVNGKDVWQDEAQMMPSYMGLVAAARRLRVVVDCWATIVRATDEFDWWTENGVEYMRHVPALDAAEAGEFRGVYAVAVLPGGHRHYIWMNAGQVNDIRIKSKSAVKGFGPWAGTESDKDEMRKKTAIRRLLKMYQDDAAMVRLLEAADNAETVIDAVDDSPALPAGPVAGRIDLRRPRADYTPGPPAGDLGNGPTAESPGGGGSSGDAGPESSRQETTAGGPTSGGGGSADTPPVVAGPTRKPTAAEESDAAAAAEAAKSKPKKAATMFDGDRAAGPGSDRA